MLETNGEETQYSQTRKYPPDRDIFDAKFDGFSLFSLEPLVLQISYIYHWKGLIYSSYEPEGEGAWRLHVTVTSSRLNL